jgi:HTH-type transcriptional regulator / antitoxin HigA
MVAILTDGHADRDTYLELVRQHPLKSISSDAELTAAQAMVDGLLDRGELDEGEEEYLDALSDLVAIYEDKHWDIEPASPRDVLAYLIESNEQTQVQVAEGAKLPPSTVSAILKGKRTINLAHAQALAAYFHVPISVFVNCPDN